MPSPEDNHYNPNTAWDVWHGTDHSTWGKGVHDWLVDKLPYDPDATDGDGWQQGPRRVDVVVRAPGVLAWSWEAA